MGICVCVYKIKLSSACFMKLLWVLILVLDPQKKAEGSMIPWRPDLQPHLPSQSSAYPISKALSYTFSR